MNFLNKIIFFYYREYKLNMSGVQDILTNIIFFFISIFIFIFSIGPDKQTISIIGVGILWTLLLLSSTLSLRKFYQDDFENGNLLIMHLNGFSFGLISILKTLKLDNYLNKKVGTLSFGETKKLEFLRLIIENKNVWILDEPLSNLDENSIELLKQTFEDHAAKQGSIIFSSHQNPGIYVTEEIQL